MRCAVRKLISPVLQASAVISVANNAPMTARAFTLILPFVTPALVMIDP
ncbi:hypothetical protein K6106_03660 [Pseudomonas fluorescens]|nr:hypothetical protein K6106_03660 [Pseudomonas fluorescens]